MKRTMELPRRGWSHYFEGLGKRALSQPLRIQVEDRELGDQALSQAQPLVEIELETKGSEVGAIELTVGNERQMFTHRIVDPERLYLLIDDEGNLECLSIEDGEGTQTLLIFEGDSGVPAWSEPEGVETPWPPMAG